MFLRPTCRGSQTPDELLALVLGSGDICRIGLTLKAFEGEVGVKARADRAIAEEELGRLKWVARKFRRPPKASGLIHFEFVKGVWVSHEMRTDAAGGLTIKTKVRDDYKCYYPKCF